VLPRLSVDPADGRVAALPLAGVRPRVLSLVWHAEREPAPALDALRAALAAVCRELSAVRR
jgi:DNA-binding transcriptional LysR family regulator